MMCKFLTYSLTLLTIVAGLFVVSACQKEEVSKNEVMLTFNTRAIVSDEVSSDADALECMKDLRVIMVRQDGTVVDNHLEQGINASSVKFTFSTPVKTGGEYFTFYAVANENSIDIDNDDNIDWLKQADGTLFANSVNEYQAQIIGKGEAYDISKGAIPQTKIWTIKVPQQDKYTVTDPLQLEYVASKISVKFVNKTNEQQSLSNIHITGITPNTQGYLFKQDGTDYIDSKDNNATSISWGKVLTLVAPTTGDKGETIYASDSVAYYTYPLAEGNFNSPMLYATWGDETEPRTLDLSGIISLKRNEHLRIEITLTPAGDITVNYTIAPWEETPTNIGDEAPTTPGNDYYVDAWGENSNIEIGGENKNGWNVAPGVTITGKEVWHWEIDIDVLESDRREIPIPSEFLVPGYELLFNFMCLNPNGPDPESIQIEFWNANDAVLVEDATFNDKTYIWDTTANYYRYFTLTERVIELINQGWSKNLVLKTINLTYPENPVHIKIIKLFIVNPDNGGASTDAEQQ